jgi:uncharacterized protein (DUF305 family)
MNSGLFLRTGLWTIMFAATLFLGACSSNAQNQAPVAADSGSMSPVGQGNMDNMMKSGGMNHSMGMDLGPADADYDLRFIDAMIPHHQGAVVMAQDALKKSKRPEIKQLANTIIKAQENEISEMQQWRQAWYPKAPSTPMAWQAGMNHMMAMSPEQKQSMMMSMDLGAADADYDLRFINAMIPHHKAAVVMAEDVLKKSKRPETKTLAQNIISSQQAEIKQMTAWRKAWYKQ